MRDFFFLLIKIYRKSTEYANGISCIICPGRRLSQPEYMYAIMRFRHLYIRVPTYMYTCKYTDRAGPYSARPPKRIRACIREYASGSMIFALAQSTPGS